ncbi:hypothetical protein MPSEU_000437700 [Mayamaea pseudoterrestris]|nr:hypothetical protein MPSEU_000437700 [Mayamaea pseudoterrestris]
MSTRIMTRTKSKSSLQDPPRIVLRNLPFNQSRNILQVEHDEGFRMSRLLRHDLFHVLLGLPTVTTMVLLACLWTANCLFFAAIIYAVDPDEAGTDCRLRSYDKPILYATAFAQSIQTASGVGYTLPVAVNSYYAHCPKLQIATYFEMSVSMLIVAFIISILIARMKNAARRAVQLVFAKKAVVSVVNGQTRLQIRAFDINARHPIVGAHVRLYAVTKDRPVPRRLRLLQPNDVTGGHLFLSLPLVVSHHIDLYSILHSPRPDNPLLRHSHGMDLRQADSATCNRDDVVCRICSETFGTHEIWVRHVQYKKIAESVAGVSTKRSHLGVGQVELDLNSYKPTTNLSILKTHFEQEISEIICVVEGIDPLTSGAFSAMHTYRASDIVWEEHAAFHPCISADSGTYKVDLDRFHEIVNVPSASRQHQVSTRVHDSFFFNENRELKAVSMLPQ